MNNRKLFFLSTMTLHRCFELIAVLLLLPTVPLVLELVVLSLAALVKPRPQRIDPHAAPYALALLIPCHNEEKLISGCIASISASEIPPSPVYVVAHNCSDRTAHFAEKSGATVLVLNDDGSRGKGAALHHGIKHALDHGAQAVMIVDADSRISPQLVGAARAAFQAGADAVQSRYIAAEGKTNREHLLALGLYGFNVLRPRGRVNLGLSSGIFGNGFALSAQTLKAVPYTAHSVVEDLEYHLRLVRSGRRVRFLDEVEVRGEMPDNREAAATQRARWEGGRMMIRKQQSGALLRGVLRGKLRLLEPLLELTALPIGNVLALLSIGAILPVWPTRLYAFFGLASIALYVAVSILLSDNPRQMISALFGVPKYLLFKLRLIQKTKMASSAEADWVRTGRNS